MITLPFAAYKTEHVLSDYFDKPSYAFEIKNYITNKYNTFPHFYKIEEKFEEDVLEYFAKNAELITLDSTLNVKQNVLNREDYWFKYEDFFVNIKSSGYDDDAGSFYSSKKTKDKRVFLYNLTIVTAGYKKTLDLSFILKYVHVSKRSKIYMLMTEEYGGGIKFEPIEFESVDCDISLNYGENFVSVYDTLKEKLSQNENGIYMLHGSPGVGKSTIIKQLTKDVKRDFCYIPSTMLESFLTNPSLVRTLLEKKNSVIIMEDAEKAIMERVGDLSDQNVVSSLLNLTDGILGDALKIAVIVTYNCQVDKVDKALRRKGRLQFDYKFEPLSKDAAKRLAKSLNYPDSLIEEMIQKEMSLADVYNLEDVVVHYEEKREKRIGFI